MCTTFLLKLNIFKFREYTLHCLCMLHKKFISYLIWIHGNSFHQTWPNRFKHIGLQQIFPVKKQQKTVTPVPHLYVNVSVDGDLAKNHLCKKDLTIQWDHESKSIINYSPDFTMCLSLSVAQMFDLFFILPKHIDMNFDTHIE